MKNKQYLIIAIATLIVFAIGGTYAFFQILGGTTETKNVNVQTYTTDLFTTNVTDEILLTADQSDFYQNAGNKTATTTASARLLPNSKTGTATEHYNVYVVIDSNNFVYTTEAHTAEIILTVTDPNGNPAGSITGLNSVSNGVFDVTTRTGAFKVAEDYEITTDSAQGTTQEWSMTITLVNLDTDQNDNTGKTLTGTIYITKENLETYSLAQLNGIRTSHLNETTGEEESNIHSTSITVDLDTTAGSEGLSNYYFGIEEASNSTGYLQTENKIVDGIEYYESNEPTYTFTGLRGNTNYTIYAFAEDRAGFKSNTYETTVTTQEYILPQVTNVSFTPTSLTSGTITANASAGENAVSKYYFNCGSGWSEAQDSNEYTCSGLSYNTNYDIKVKVIDTYGEYSTDYVVPSEIRAYQVTYTCTNCTSSKNSEYILAGTSSTADIIPSTNYNLTNATVSGCTLSNGVATVSNISADTICNITAAPNEATCSAGQYLAASATTCSSCPAGSYCPGGTYLIDGSEHGITTCSAGYYCPAGSSNQTACATGSYSPAGASECTACNGGYTNSGTGNTSCATTCSNSANVASWKTPTWSANTVSNLCAANTCATNYKVSGDNCVASWSCASGTLTADSNKGASSGGYVCVTNGVQNCSEYMDCAEWSGCGCEQWSSNGSFCVVYGCSTCERYEPAYDCSWGCSSGWAWYSGSGSSTKCYKAATAG